MPYLSRIEVQINPQQRDWQRIHILHTNVYFAPNVYIASLAESLMTLIIVPRGQIQKLLYPPGLV